MVAAEACTHQLESARVRIHCDGTFMLWFDHACDAQCTPTHDPAIAARLEAVGGGCVCSLESTSLSTHGNFNAPIYKLIRSKTDLRDWGAASSRSHGRPHEPWACWQAAGLGPCPQNLYCTIYLHCITSNSLDSQSKWLSHNIGQCTCSKNCSSPPACVSRFIPPQ